MDWNKRARCWICVSFGCAVVNGERMERMKRTVCEACVVLALIMGMQAYNTDTPQMVVRDADSYRLAMTLPRIHGIPFSFDGNESLQGLIVVASSLVVAFWLRFTGCVAMANAIRLLLA